MRRGEIWWAELPNPRGSEPGFRRPVVIVQSDSFNASRIRTVIVAAITTNTLLAKAPGNVLLARNRSRLPKSSVVNVSQLLALDKSYLTRRVGRIPADEWAAVEDGLRLVLDL